MVFNDSSGGLGIVQDVQFRTNTNVNEFTLKNITIYANEAYSRVANLIIGADGRMQWDDVNHTDQPISVFDLVASQGYYEIFSAAPTALQDWLVIDRVEVKDANGEWFTLKPLDRNDIPTVGSFMDTAGVPEYFDFNGSELLMYPASNYASSGGAKIFFKRSPSYFASTDTTKRPGFATIFHSYISAYTAHQWNMTKKNDNKLQLFLDKMEIDIAKFYSKRNKVEVPVISRAYDSFK